MQVRPGQSEKTTINEFDPGLLLQLGDHWRLDYAVRFLGSIQLRLRGSARAFILLLAGVENLPEWQRQHVGSHLHRPHLSCYLVGDHYATQQRQRFGRLRSPRNLCAVSHSFSFHLP